MDGTERMRGGTQPGSRGAASLVYRRRSNVAFDLPSFGISRQTLYCWQRLYDGFDLSTLEGAQSRQRPQPIRFAPQRRRF